MVNDKSNQNIRFKVINTLPKFKDKDEKELVKKRLTRELYQVFKKYK